MENVHKNEDNNLNPINIVNDLENDLIIIEDNQNDNNKNKLENNENILKPENSENENNANNEKTDNKENILKMNEDNEDNDINVINENRVENEGNKLKIEAQMNEKDNQDDNNDNKNNIEQNEKRLTIDNPNSEDNKNEIKEGIIKTENEIIEEDNQKQFHDNINPETNIEEKPETSKIIGDVETRTSSSNNLYYLGNLFRDVVNKYDKEKDDMNETRKLIRKTIKKNILNNNIISEQQPFNFNDIINVQLNEVKQNTLSYLDKAKNELDKRYSLYIQKVNNYINENELKISKVFQVFESNENFMNYADDNIFKQIDYLLEIHENIFSALEDHINLLFTFLDQISLIKQKNPFEHFLNTNSNEILNCWFLSKINFNKLSLSNVIINKDLSDLVSGYLCKKRENNFAKITIQKDKKGNLSLESEFLRDNINNLEKLKFLGLSSDSVMDILKNLNKKQMNKKRNMDDNIQIGKKLHSLSIIKTNFTHSDLPKFSLPILRKAKIKKSLFHLNYFFDSIIGQTSFLKIIDIQNCKMNDKDFLEFFYYLGQKKYLQDSLQYLGFSGNELTYINLKRFILKGGELKNLKYFDLSKNNIYEFVTDNFKAIPLLKVLDLSDNNISNYVFFDSIYSLYKKKQMPCMVLLSNNIFVSNNKINNREYRKYIYQILTTFKYKIKKVNLSLLYNKDNIEELTTLRISPSVKISLVKLNLSFCGLKTEAVWKFFQNNFGLLNLVSLDLSYNFISNNFFSLCAGQDILLEKLKVIDLSMNLIKCKNMNELNQIEIFINNYQKLKKIKIQRNEFANDIITLYKSNTKEIDKIIDKLKLKGIKFFIETHFVVFDRINQIIELKDKKI